VVTAVLMIRRLSGVDVHILRAEPAV
jgi:hypothetical protein